MQFNNKMSVRPRSRRTELLEKYQGRYSQTGGGNRRTDELWRRRNLVGGVAIFVFMICLIASQRSMNEAMNNLRSYSIGSETDPETGTATQTQTSSQTSKAQPAQESTSVNTKTSTDTATSPSTTETASTSTTSTTKTTRTPSNPSNLPPPPVGSLEIVKAMGDNWKVWDRASVLHEDLPGMTCNWSEYKPAHSLPTSTTPSAPMCLHPFERDKTVSGSIMDTGKWPDCDILTPILRGNQEKHPDQPLIHVEIGANIGSCVMQVLLTTEATIYAFEPHPENLYHLTSTLLKLDESLRNRVNLFPIALGVETGSSTMIINRKNAGNAQVNAPPPGAAAAAAPPPPNGATVIAIERIDDLLTSPTTGALPVSLIKMDAQGFECFIVGGMPKLLEATQALVFEVETRQMTRLKGACSPAKLVDAVQAASFNLYQLHEETGEETDQDLPNFARFGVADTMDLIARKKRR